MLRGGNGFGAPWLIGHALADRNCTASSARTSWEPRLIGHAQRRQLGPVVDRAGIKGQGQNDMLRAGRSTSPIFPRRRTIPGSGANLSRVPTGRDPGEFPLVIHDRETTGSHGKDVREFPEPVLQPLPAVVVSMASQCSTIPVDRRPPPGPRPRPPSVVGRGPLARGCPSRAHPAGGDTPGWAPGLVGRWSLDRVTFGRPADRSPRSRVR
jgi:hypothetical protein